MDIVVSFNPRDTHTIKGIWGTGVPYTNRNDKDENGNYVPMEVTQDAKDSNGDALLDKLGTIQYTKPNTYRKVRYHDRYQGACRSHWNPGLL